jgi:hypothetical protein
MAAVVVRPSREEERKEEPTCKLSCSAGPSTRPVYFTYQLATLTARPWSKLSVQFASRFR